MKRSGLKLGSILAVAVLAVLVMGQTWRAMAQDKPASVHGHVNNAIGASLTKGEVRLTTDRTSDPKNRKYAYTFPISATGDYTGTGIAPNNYVAIVFVEDKSLDFVESVVFAAGEDKTLNFDMSRKEYIDKMTPEEKKQLEEFRKKNAEVMSANSKIANLNALLQQARADNKSGNYAAAITAMQQATTAKPDEAILWIALADGQLGSADTDAKAAKAAGKPANDPAIVQGYTDAAASYKKAADLNTAAKKPSPETAGVAYSQLGQALIKQGDTKGATDAYDAAAKALPTSAATYYYNEAATFYNMGKTDDAAVAADKAITADPKRADAYYIKGQALIPKATVDPKTQKITAPPGCVEAYQSYLELVPTGPRADEVKAILSGIGAKVESTYKAGKKK